MLKVGFNARTGFREVAPFGGGKIIFQMILRGIRQGRACTARPRWGQWKSRSGFHGGLDKDGRAQHAPYPLFYISSNQKPLGTGQVGYDTCKKSIAGKHGFGFFGQIPVQFEKGRSVRR